MIETFYYGALAVAFAWALIDWRRGLYLCLLFDVIRDPVRKLAAGNSVAITLAGVALWLAVFVGAYNTLGPRLFTVLGQYRPLRTGITLLFLALIPAALVSLVSYPAGWMLAGVGFASYTLPIVGIVVGFHLLRRTEDVWRLLAFYCLINAVALSGFCLRISPCRSPRPGWHQDDLDPI